MATTQKHVNLIDSTCIIIMNNNYCIHVQHLQTFFEPHVHLKNIPLAYGQPMLRGVETDGAHGAVNLMITKTVFTIFMKTSDQVNCDHVLVTTTLRLDTIFAMWLLGLVLCDIICTSETLTLTCQVDRQVIIVRRALYGRMEPGKCITSEYAHAMGCYADVTTHVQDLCSGQSHCSLMVASIDAIAQPCGKDFKSYLDIEHECVRATCGRQRVGVCNSRAWRSCALTKRSCALTLFECVLRQTLERPPYVIGELVRLASACNEMEWSASVACRGSASYFKNHIVHLSIFSGLCKSNVMQAGCFMPTRQVQNGNVFNEVMKCSYRHKWHKSI
ncbi:hypothetical protein HELRODRAFT_169361 [Helobdella robusta]|uniref:SUEL-type lectin domain-containing protein n=1 Tax=Helobdella robusta TaxID=6412 RepID=T1F1U4_HELRO|nr:hypothetical protein HELRODRAFT_169361 [Helobdella robusta]ESO08503.1 hypothetical protein HELRODRAFT_169361 [Helobdella robusta]